MIKIVLKSNEEPKLEVFNYCSPWLLNHVFHKITFFLNISYKLTHDSQCQSPYKFKPKMIAWIPI